VLLLGLRVQHRSTAVGAREPVSWAPRAELVPTCTSPSSWQKMKKTKENCQKNRHRSWEKNGLFTHLKNDPGEYWIPLQRPGFLVSRKKQIKILSSRVPFSFNKIDTKKGTRQSYPLIVCRKKKETPLSLTEKKKSKNKKRSKSK
jgi:hypothetical protein